MKISKRINFLYVLGQAATVTPAPTTPTTPTVAQDLNSSSPVFRNANAVWSTVMQDIIKIANILNKVLFKISGNRASLDRIELATPGISTLSAGPGEDIMKLCKQLVDNVLDLPPQSDINQKRKAIVDFKNLFDSKKSNVSNLLSSKDIMDINNILNLLLSKIK